MTMWIIYVAGAGIAPASRGSLILTICYQMEWTIPSPLPGAPIIVSEPPEQITFYMLGLAADCPISLRKLEFPAI